MQITSYILYFIQNEVKNPPISIVYKIIGRFFAPLRYARYALNEIK